jgi:hypothetical protein
MFRILKTIKDTYITNKIINNKFRADDANVGQAATLDLFKLYGENKSGSFTTGSIELSRILIKFNLDPLRSLTGSILDISHQSFNCKLELFDVYGGQPTPSNFKVIAFPLSQAFDEGIGRDLFNFADVDAANFLTASITESDTATAWFVSGANKQGELESENLDIISSGTLSGSGGDGIVDLWKQQSFPLGTEDLSIDVTTVVSATLSGLIPDHGFRLSFSGTQETDQYSRFVKRFASRHNSNTRIRPRIVVKYNDSLQDHHESFIFNKTGSLFLNNFHRNAPANIRTGSSAIGLSGSNCLKIRLVSGSFTKTIAASQHKIGNSFVTGVYSASFAISQFNTTLRPEIINAGSATFDVYWGDNDSNTITNVSTYGYHTGTLVIKSPFRTSFSNITKNLVVRVTNLRPSYTSTQKVRLRIYVKDTTEKIKFVKTPRELKSVIFTNMHYRIKDAYSNDIIVPFDTTYNSTLLSVDSEGMYFDMYLDSFDVGRVYQIDFLVKDEGIDNIISDCGKFRVDV